MNKIISSILIATLFLSTSNASEKLADPTRPEFASAVSPQEPTVKQTNLNLSAIFIKNNQRSAIISDSLYQVGDTFSGHKVVAIEKTSVLLKNNDGYRRLKLINTFKKRKK